MREPCEYEKIKEKNIKERFEAMKMSFEGLEDTKITMVKIE